MGYFSKGRTCTGRCGRSQGTSPSGFYSAGFNGDFQCPTCVRFGKPVDADLLARYRAQDAAIEAYRASKA